MKIICENMSRAEPHGKNIFVIHLLRPDIFFILIRSKNELCTFKEKSQSRVYEQTLGVNVQANGWALVRSVWVIILFMFGFNLRFLPIPSYGLGKCVSQ